jgi:hypothetical protein
MATVSYCFVRKAMRAGLALVSKLSNVKTQWVAPRQRLFLATAGAAAMAGWPLIAVGGEAIPFAIDIPGGEEIVFKRDHYDVVVLQGWISSEDRFFRSLMAKKSKLVIALTARSRYFDGQTDTFSRLFENTDIKKNTDRPWGVGPVLLDDVPADVRSDIQLRLAINRDDRLSSLFSAVKDAEPEAVGIDVTAWQGYSRVLSALVNGLVGTTATSYPFLYEGDVIRAPGPTSMKEQYLVLIAPAFDGDPFFNGVTSADLKYEDQRLKFRNQNLTGHSYAVLAVRKGSPFDIAALVYESQAPWAVLARTQFTSIPTDDISEQAGLVQLSVGLLSQLMTETNLLMAEHRFSVSDRASALTTFATRSRDQIARRCGALGINGQMCPTNGIDQFIENLPKAFGLRPEEFQPQEIDLDAAAAQAARR